MENNLEHVPGKGSGNAQDQPPKNPAFDQSQPEPNMEMVLKQRIHTNSGKHKIIHDSQGGSWAGCSAIDLACKKIATFDIIQIARQIVAEISNDAANCFDWMIEVCQNLSCHQRGANINSLKLHTQTILLLHSYHVKHAFGISTEYNTHSDEHPWYGTGQGAGNMAHQWVVLANSLILAYLSQADPWNLTSPDQKISLTQGFDAFMDDTAMTITAANHQWLVDIVVTAQSNLTL